MILEAKKGLVKCVAEGGSTVGEPPSASGLELEGCTCRAWDERRRRESGNLLADAVLVVACQLGKRDPEFGVVCRGERGDVLAPCPFLGSSEYGAELLGKKIERFTDHEVVLALGESTEPTEESAVLAGAAVLELPRPEHV